MTAKTYVLRDLPGVRELEAEAKRFWADKNREWSKEFDGIEERQDLLCRRLFGVTAEEVDEIYAEPDEPRHRYWERVAEHRKHFEFWFEDGAVEVFASMGWDVCDERGEPLACLSWLARPLISAAKGLKGRLPDAPKSDAEIAANTEAFEAKMLADAEAFRRRQRGRERA